MAAGSRSGQIGVHIGRWSAIIRNKNLGAIFRARLRLETDSVIDRANRMTPSDLSSVVRGARVRWDLIRDEKGRKSRDLFLVIHLAKNTPIGGPVWTLQALR